MTAADPIAAIRRDLILGDSNLVVIEAGARPPAAVAEEVRARGRDHPLLVAFDGAPDERGLIALRDAVWPDVHLVSIYAVDAAGRLVRRMSGRSDPLAEGAGGGARTIVHARNREEALGRRTTRLKFDLQAEGWNGAPGSPTYGHYRWMRRLLAEAARPRRGERCLDAGCGTGWVGIEAARMGAMVSAFDASEAMVGLALANAEEAGVDLDARVGFVEEAPFDRPFELVLNSGVISFAPDAETYLAGLDALVEPGGRLCIGDINPASRGFSRRRARHALLPARELNGLPRAMVEELLAMHGYAIDGVWNYQLTFPVPELMALSEQRLGGLGCGALLVANKVACRLDHALGARGRRGFDSWIVLASKPAGAGAT